MDIHSLSPTYYCAFIISSHQRQALKAAYSSTVAINSKLSLREYGMEDLF
jgi:hypothetical protein